MFRLIQQQSGTAAEEMYKVFNMGHRMEIYLDPDLAATVIDISRNFNIDAQVIGRVESSSQREVQIRSSLGSFVYS